MSAAGGPKDIVKKKEPGGRPVYDDGERSKKKVNSSILDDFKKLLDKKMDYVMAHVDQKIESVNRHVEKLKKVDQNQNEAPLPEKTDEELKNMIFNYTDIEMLEEVLESEALGIKKEVDINEKIDGNYCDICYAGTKPDFTSLVGTSVGAFTFNKLDNTKLESAGAKPKQSKVFINRKSNVRIHLSGKTHRQKLNILKIKDKALRERLTREERPGWAECIQREI